jgi:hypothetical protein
MFMIDGPVLSGWKKYLEGLSSPIKAFIFY